MKEGSDHIEFQELVIKSITGEATSDEVRMLEDEISSSPSKKKILDDFKEIWDGTYQVKGFTKAEIDYEWNRLNGLIEDSDGKSGGRKFFLRIAASVLILLSLSIAYYFFTDPFQSGGLATTDTMDSTLLADGTNITLNERSKITYGDDYNQSSRVVKLEGEAFFEVKKDDKKPFIIRVEEIEITVMGTSFNVKAYSEDETVEVVVSSGLVAITKNEGDSLLKKLVLKPGDKGVYHKVTGDLKLIENDEINYLSWKTKVFIFNEVPLHEAVRLLAEIYDQPIKIASKDLSRCPITASFDNQSIDSIIKILQSTLELEVTRRGKEIVLSGPDC